MKQLEFYEIPSPCIGVCQSGPKGFCLGCFRSREERLYWNQLDDSAKRAVFKISWMMKKRAQGKDKKELADAGNIEQQSWDF
jgi:predicted Fe-S protein YdhL (DUF1289 family)